MAVSTDLGFAFLTAAALFAVSFVIPGDYVLNLPAALRTRMQLCNRLAPLMLLTGVALVLIGLALNVGSS